MSRPPDWIGRRLTVGEGHDPDCDPLVDAEELERLADEAEAGYPSDQGQVVYRRRGRPSLSGAAAPSPQLRVRVPEDLRRRAAERAAREGSSLSEITREALERYLAG
ncbi:MAG: hypothetical protein WEB03_10475 [Nitriliruptor sp.]|uniref:CopG family transcriptional regulator n=1 Tax=Nitriliruptor sp. TaxID=2448056 RepID=UPI0034A08B7B